jgi:hypothetical protein
MAKDFKVAGRMKVKTVKKDFKEAFGIGIRIYKGVAFADDDATLASIRSGAVKGGDIALHGATKIGNVEKKFKEEFGIRVQIENKKGDLADNSITLSQAGK